MANKGLIKTIRSNYEYKFKEKGSLFVGLAFPVNTEEECAELLNSIKKKYYDATHHCSAYFLYPEIFKYSDDGEPNGTAGIRIFNAIKHFELINIFIVIVRYFGGTKLGVGPLGKAYYNTAYETLKLAEVIEKQEYTKMTISFDFEFINSVHHLLSQYKAVIKKNIFETKPAIECLILPEVVETLQKDLVDSTAGKLKITSLEEGIFL